MVPRGAISSAGRGATVPAWGARGRDGYAEAAPTGSARGGSIK